MRAWLLVVSKVSNRVSGVRDSNGTKTDTITIYELRLDDSKTANFVGVSYIPTRLHL